MAEKLEMLYGEAKAEAVRRGLTRTDVAKKYGCTENRISCIMAQRYVTKTVANRLADAIGVPVTKITREIQR